MAAKNDITAFCHDSSCDDALAIKTTTTATRSPTRISGGNSNDYCYDYGQCHGTLPLKSHRRRHPHLTATACDSSAEYSQPEWSANHKIYSERQQKMDQKTAFFDQKHQNLSIDVAQTMFSSSLRFQPVVNSSSRHRAFSTSRKFLAPVMIFANFFVLFLSLVVADLTSANSTVSSGTSVLAAFPPLSSSHHSHLVSLPRQLISSNSTLNFQLRHMQLEEHSNKLYVSGVNILLQLNANTLSLEDQVVTGPHDDSEQCSARGSCQLGAQRSPTDNYNKALVVDDDNGVLISCGSLYQGICERYKLGRISEKLPDVPVPVAANDALSSTVAFIAPGLPNPRSHRVLYVGATHTRAGPYRSQEQTPILSARMLSLDEQKAFQVIRARRFARANVKLDQFSLETFDIQYVRGFYHDGFAYFVTVQPQKAQDKDAGYVSKIVRVCANDPEFHSYSEVTLQCKSGRDGVSSYNLAQAADVGSAGQRLSESLGIRTTDKILVVAFAKAHRAESNVAARASAVCTYTMFDVESKFRQNADRCFSGVEKSRGLGFIAGANLNCPTESRTVDSLCNSQLLIEGTVPLIAETTIQFDTELITSVAIARTHDHTIAVLGTSQGKLKKVELVDRAFGRQYAELLIDRDYTGPILPDTRLDKAMEVVYVLTEKKVYKVKISDCSRYNDCSSCLAAKDPFCGWCSLEKRCTLQTECTSPFALGSKNGLISGRYWLPFTEQQCVDFLRLAPDNVAYDSTSRSTTIDLQIRELPVMSSPDPNTVSILTYSCVFGSNFPQPATVTETGLRCPTPPRRSLKLDFEAGKDYAAVPLAVRSSLTGKDFISRPFYFYDCSRHTSCSNCTSSRWPCHWCVDQNSCTNDATSCDASMIYGRASPLMADANKGPQHCPAIDSAVQTEILIASGRSRAIELNIRHLSKLLHRRADAGGNFQCRLTVADMTNTDQQSATTVVTVPAEIRQHNTVVCNEAFYNYKANSPTLQAKLSLYWNGNMFVDNTDVVMYKCEVLATDCNTCLTLSSKYQCVWFDGRCQYSSLFSHYSNSRLSSENAARTCPKPFIDSISPQNGPIEGGTIVEIRGREMGMQLADIDNITTVAGMPCVPLDYEVSRKLVCRTTTGGQFRREISNGSAIVSVLGRSSDASSAKFYFQNPELYRIYPTSGPQAGGTTITIEGNHLDIGSTREITIGGLPCQIDPARISQTRLYCLNSAAPYPDFVAQAVTLRIDRANRTLPAVEFQYHPNPDIVGVDPVASIFSGGNIAHVYGSFFQPEMQAEMFITPFDNWTYIVSSAPCTVKSSTLMLCTVPALPTNVDELLRTGVIGAVSTAQDESGFSLSPRIQRTSPSRQRRSLSAAPSSATKFADENEYEQDTVSNFLSSNLRSLPSRIEFQLGFRMDGWRSNLSAPYDTLVYYPDPVLYPFDSTTAGNPSENGIKHFRGDSLILDGERLNLALGVADYSVIILPSTGNNDVLPVLCNVTSVTERQLTCQPESLNAVEVLFAHIDRSSPNPVDLPLVRVQVGSNSDNILTLGRLFLDDDSSSLTAAANSSRLARVAAMAGLPPAAVGAIAGFLFVLLLVGAALLSVYRRRSTQAEREYKRIQLRMDTLESSVRSECKQAFAELQTHMQQIDLPRCDLSDAASIPWLEHRLFVMRTFFPANSTTSFSTLSSSSPPPFERLEHPLLQKQKYNSGSAVSSTLDAAMLEFQQLLLNKPFLLQFIDCLEQQQTFKIRDRSNVASLLSVILMSHMPYATDIMQCQLGKLIDGAVASKHPQIMLRRAESIVEKMLSNWLALCMHEFLTTTCIASSSAAAAAAGETEPPKFGTRNPATALYVLLRAMKHTIEKGPVDAVTHEARYSLSESRLLRQQVDCSPVNIFLHQQTVDDFVITAYSNNMLRSSNNTGHHYQIHCTVLDCDTVTQVKSKLLDAIYRNMPFSARLVGTSDVDLEWRPLSGAAVILQDEDSTSVVEFAGGWKRLNTLRHYGVVEQAVMRLVSRGGGGAPAAPTAESVHSSSHTSASTITTTSSHSSCSPSSSLSSSSSPYSVTPNSQILLNSSNTNRRNHQHHHHHQHYNSDLTATTAIDATKFGPIPIENTAVSGGDRVWHLVKPAGSTSDADSNDSSYNSHGTMLLLPQKRADLNFLNKTNQNRSASATSDQYFYADLLKQQNTAAKQHRQSSTVMPPVSAIPEIYLTRLLSSKGTLQNYIDDFFASILDARHPAMAPAKWLFDLFDDAANMRCVEDAQVLHSWKSNSLMLRFWVNVIKNPEFLFDMQTSPTMEACLSVVAQTLMDACSFSDGGMKLGKDSPSNKLLFAKDMPQYRLMVREFYANLRTLPPQPSNEAMQACLYQISTKYINNLNIMNALKELYTYAVKYEVELTERLEADPLTQRMNLSHQLEAVAASMSYYTIPHPNVARKTGTNATAKTSQAFGHSLLVPTQSFVLNSNTATSIYGTNNNDTHSPSSFNYMAAAPSFALPPPPPPPPLPHMPSNLMASFQKASAYPPSQYPMTILNGGLNPVHSSNFHHPSATLHHNPQQHAQQARHFPVMQHQQSMRVNSSNCPEYSNNQLMHAQQLHHQYQQAFSTMRR